LSINWRNRRRSLGKNKNKDPLSAVKVGEVVREKASSDKEKAEGRSSTEKEKREQTPLERGHAELEAKAKDATEGHEQLLHPGAEFENYKKQQGGLFHVETPIFGPRSLNHKCRVEICLIIT
jgi:hypothetical protein